MHVEVVRVEEEKGLEGEVWRLHFKRIRVE